MRLLLEKIGIFFFKFYIFLHNPFGIACARNLITFGFNDDLTNDDSKQMFFNRSPVISCFFMVAHVVLKMPKKKNVQMGKICNICGTSVSRNLIYRLFLMYQEVFGARL